MFLSNEKRENHIREEEIKSDSGIERIRALADIRANVDSKRIDKMFINCITEPTNVKLEDRGSRVISLEDTSLFII